MKFNRVIASALLIFAALLAPYDAVAQTITTPETGVTAEFLENRIAEAETSAEVDEATRAILLDRYRKSLSLIRQRQAYEAKTVEFVEMRETAPREAQARRQQLEKLEAQPPLGLPGDLEQRTLSQLEQLLLGEKAKLSGLRATLVEITALLEAESLREQQVRGRLEQARRKQAEIAQTIQLPAPSSQAQQVAEANLWALQLETRTLGTEIEMLNQEFLSLPMRLELYNAKRDLTSLQWDRQQAFVEALTGEVSARRVSDAESAQQAAAEIERQSFGKHPMVQEMAERNTRLGNDLNELAGLLEGIRADEGVVAEQVKRFSANFRLARQKLEIAGLNQALGQALLQQRNQLPRAKDFRSAEKLRSQLVVDSSLRQIRNQEERVQLSDIDAFVAAAVDSLSPSWQGWLSKELRVLALQRRDLLDKAIAADDSLLQALSELDFAQRELSTVVEDYNRFMDERLLWVRTGEPPSLRMLESMDEVVRIFSDSTNWQDMLNTFLAPQSFPWVLISGLMLFVLLIQQRPRLRAALHRSGRMVGELRHDRLGYSIRALLQTLVLALPWPLLFVTIGLHLQLARGEGDLHLHAQLYQIADWSGQFVPSIGAAFIDIALYTLLFRAFILFCEPRGLAVKHFQWRESSTSLLRRETRRLMLVFLPAVFLVSAIVTYRPEALAGAFSRLLICLIVVALAWYFGRILAPKSGALGEYYRQNPSQLLSWLRYLWPALGFLLPLTLAGLALAGFVYTAAQLGARLIDTLWLLVGIILIHQLVVRWVVLLERQLEFRDALERHRAQRAARDSSDSDPQPLDAVEEPEIDFSALSGDTKKLINSALVVVAAFGMWAIWSDVLPAFRILDDVSLWSYTSTVDGTAQVVPVTLGNVITGLLIVVLGIIAARWLPALLEIALFARFNITAGSRYAISKLTQYSIISVGIVLVFSVLGGSWGEIQWLIAALGVGIGFGLQEIIANFISGLILLFERPIRIGDIVTVGETTGVVTKIRIRSTTIRNWDQQELLVPNKEFITGRLLNWTLSDPIARIVIGVGIAYGSDVTRAMKIIVDSAEQHERVLDEPPPLVTFENFGDNALEIKLRCYIDSMDYRLVTLSEINQAINRDLEAAGIVIAFPQRDIHLDTSQPLDIHLHRAPTPADSG